MPTTLNMRPAPKAKRPLTGRAVLIMLMAFFAVVAGANAIMLRAATSTFGGVETGSSYKAGLAFKNELAAAQAQDARHWSVGATLNRVGEHTSFLITIADEAGRQRANLTATARFAHPSDARRDRPAVMVPQGDGRLVGEAAVPAGQWDLILDIAQGDERIFRSRNRVILK